MHVGKRIELLENESNQLKDIVSKASNKEQVKKTTFNISARRNTTGRSNIQGVSDWVLEYLKK